MAKRIVIAAAITVAFVIAIFAGSGEDTGIDVRSPKLEMSPTTVPEMINYQGVLTDDTDNPLDTTVTMTFTIYDAASGGTALWTETRGSVTTVGGVFTVLLGSGTPLPPTVFEGPDRWLGVKVGADPEMAPRRRIASSAYTYRSSYADDSDMLDGQHASDFAEAAHDHDDQYYTEIELNTSDGDGPNEGSNRVHWDNLWGVPAGFADGTDDVETGGISQISAGTGIEVTNPTGPITTVSANIGTTASKVAAGDHEHDADYVNEGQTSSVTSDMIVDGTVEQTDLSFDVPDGHSLDAADDSPTDALYVDNDGNVGIGTTGPGTKLNIDGGGIRIERESGDLTGGQTYGLIYQKQNLYGGAYDGLVLKSDVLQIQDDSGGNVVMIDNSGNVGIGTTSPGSKLEVVGNVKLGNATEGLCFQDDGDYVSILGLDTGGSAYNPIHIRTGSAGTGIYVKTDGNVGIGTMSPGEKLDVNGNIAIGATKKLYLDGGGNTYIYESSADNMTFYAGGNDIFTINSTGLHMPNDLDLFVGSGRKLYLDGGTCTYIEGKDNYIDFYVDNSINFAITDAIVALNKDLRPSGTALNCGTASEYFDTIHYHTLQSHSFSYPQAENVLEAIDNIDIEKKDTYPVDVYCTAPIVNGEKEGTDSIDTGQLLGYLIESVKELKKANEELEARIKQLEGH